MADPKRILVFRNGQIGNTLVAVPALRALKKRYPAAEIHAIVDGLARETLRDCPYVDRLILYERHRKDRFLSRHGALLKTLRGEGYDLALLFKRFLRNELLAFLAGARLRAGFRSPGHRPFALHVLEPYDGQVSVAELNLRLLDRLGVPRDGLRLEFWSRPEADARYAELAHARGWDAGRRWLAVHSTGATIGAGGLSPDRLLELAGRLRVERGLDSAWLFGPGEVAAAEAVRAALGTTGIVLQGESLATAGRVIGGARLFVGHDSGPAHLAHATGCPSLVVYDDRREGWESNLRRWKPPGSACRALLVSRCDREYLLRQALEQLEAFPPSS